jgi:nitroreductase
MTGISAAQARDLVGEELLRRIVGRRSVPPRRLLAPGPSGDEIATIIEAACAAPDHKGLQPFRFEWIGLDERPALADAFEAAGRELDPVATPEALARERERAMHAPVLLALIVREVRDEVPLIEQHASAGAALGYALLASECLGYGAMAVSGEKLRSSAMRQAFRLSAAELLLCFIAIGTPEKMKERRDAPTGRLRRWLPKN